MALHKKDPNGLLPGWPRRIPSRWIDDPAPLDWLKTAVSAREKNHPERITRVLVDGRDPETALMDWPDKAIASLRLHLSGALTDFIITVNGVRSVMGTARVTTHVTAGANISYRDGFRRLHTHHSAVVSGIVCIDCRHTRSGRCGFRRHDPSSRPAPRGGDGPDPRASFRRYAEAGPATRHPAAVFQPTAVFRRFLPQRQHVGFDRPQCRPASDRVPEPQEDMP